jgi:hypothetical protein
MANLTLDHAIPYSLVSDSFVYTIDDVNVIFMSCSRYEQLIPAYI